MNHIYARLTKSGTAAAETAVCDQHLALSQPAPDTVGEPTDCTGNDALSCTVCGIS